MSTRCIIAVPDEDRIFRGRYVHFDGYPVGVGLQLSVIFERDGFALAARILVEENLGWSFIKCDQTAETSSIGRSVPGYGVAYTDGPDIFLTGRVSTWCAWAYVLSPEGIAVWQWKDFLGWSVQPIPPGRR